MNERSALFVELHGRTPQEAKFFWTGGPVEVAERTWFTSQFSGTTAFETDDGLVLVDTGVEGFAPHLAQLTRTVTDAPVHTAVYTHGHVDHAYGLDRFLVDGQAEPRVIGHRAMAARFQRYERTKAHNQAINVRQFGGAVPEDSPSLFKSPVIPPNEYYDGDGMTLTVGGLDFELHHARGETDDHTWVWCPQRRVLCPGDLFIWAVPNAGNPQKVQRYPWEWAAALREMATLEPASLCPGHGGPVVGDTRRIVEMLTTTADYLETIVERTLDTLNAGSPPHVDIVAAVDLPSSDLAWLQPVYDDPEFIVRNVIRHYGGWWSGRPSELKPAPRHDVAAEIVALAGGGARVADRAVELARAGRMRVACHLADLALEADPDDPSAQEAVAAVYGERSAQEPSLMAANIYASAVAYAKVGRPYA
ncbi:MAG: MBL fold metallo-hydrolase [Acidimicrobiia bacterium]|nr:MBL fold metallo-hydrolase [Acidimicrobiia bacterium]